MVALHTGRLTARDLFPYPGNIWSDEQHQTRRTYHRDKAIAAGVTDTAGLIFAVSNGMISDARPWVESGLRAQQAAIARVYPRHPVPVSGLTKEEWEYLAERLSGVNDPVGAAIRAKAQIGQAG